MDTVPDAFRPFRKLLVAVADLHTRGYQRLRIIPYRYQSLGAWRCAIAPSVWVSSGHGAVLDRNSPVDEVAKYASADGRTYWGWEDKSDCSPGELAAVFIELFPRLTALGYGQDWMYVGWYQHMMHLTYPDALPICNSPFDHLSGIVVDYSLARDTEPDGYMTTLGRLFRFALPPVGNAQFKASNPQQY